MQKKKPSKLLPEKADIDPHASFFFEKTPEGLSFAIGRAPVYAIVVLCVVGWYGPTILPVIASLKLLLNRAI